MLQRCLLSSAPSSWIYQLLPPLFLFCTRLLLLPLFPALRSEGCGFILSSSKFGTAGIASSCTATTEPGHGPDCCYPELLHCSCVMLSSTTDSSHAAQSCPASTCRSWLASGRPSAFRLHVGQMQLQHWSPTVLGSAVATCKQSCVLANIYGSGNVQ